MQALSLLSRKAHRSLYLCKLYSRRRYGTHSTLLDDLIQRGFVQDVTRPEALQQDLQSKLKTVYAGIDPTAASLHIGHLIPLMCLLHFQIHGHRIIPLIGGATGRIGDPSGRLVERQLANVEHVNNNVVALTSGLQTFFRRALDYAKSRLNKNEIISSEPTVISNLDWHEKFTMLDFLQNVGVHSRVNTMLNRECVRARLKDQHGLSFTEFTYQLLQAYDFFHLHKYHGCSIQVGGSDQWGNILAGLELIGRRYGGSSESSGAEGVYGVTTPLLTTASGQKFGKSAGNAVWLDSKLTSVFDFYQYFIKVADSDVQKYLNLFSLLSTSEIDDIMVAHMETPEKRIAQRRLASEVTELVHTRNEMIRAQTLTTLLFDSDYAGLDTQQIIHSFQGDNRLVFVDREEILNTPVIKLASKHGLVMSSSAARALVNAKGLYLNNHQLSEIQYCIKGNQLIDNRVAILRAGKDKLLVLASI